MKGPNILDPKCTLWLFLFTAYLLLRKAKCEDDAVEEYKGRYLGEFSTYHHQVQGKVYAVDQYTLLIKNFVYDGNGPDAYFWAGSTNHASNKGFIVSDENGRANKLRRYNTKDIILVLPDKKTLSDIRWLTVYDLSLLLSYGEIPIPEGFEPPTTQRLHELSRKARGVQSKPVAVIDSKTILIPSLSYDGTGKDVYFLVGSGPQPISKGHKIPDQNGYLGPLSAYKSEDVLLELPGKMTIFDIDWISLWDFGKSENLGSVIIPDDLNVPPSLLKIIENESRLPNCEQLHKRFQMHWEVFGPAITIELAAQIGEEDYMSFGFSGSENTSQMIGSDVVIAYINGHLGLAIDYNVTDTTSCALSLGTLKGVCQDLQVGGNDDVQIHTFARTDGITKITYRRSLISSDSGDRTFEEGDLSLIWALGHLGRNKEPLYHYIYPRKPFKLNLLRTPAHKNCFAFTEAHTNKDTKKPEIWEPFKISNPDITTFNLTLGPSAGDKGYEGITGLPAPPFVWYVNGLLAPTLYVQRGKTYTFIVDGGNNPGHPGKNHPFYVTDSPFGGYEQQTAEERRMSKVFAGVDFDRRHRPIPTTVGRLCMWTNNQTDPRKFREIKSYWNFRSKLSLKCEPGDSAILQWTPNVTTPDLLYYQSFTQQNMGWKINVVDQVTLGKAPSLSEPFGLFFVTLSLILYYI